MKFDIKRETTSGYTFLGLFSGAGGLDLGFDLAGFQHTESNEILSYCVKTLTKNRPSWSVIEGDVHQYLPKHLKGVDVITAGFPCQGFSLGGNRDPNDERNLLYRQVIKIAKVVKPRVLVLENVLNLRTMNHPVTDKPFANQIIDELAAIGYSTITDFFRVSDFGVPQTRRRFIFVAFRGKVPDWYVLPQAGKTETIRKFIYDLGQGQTIDLPNHEPIWDFESYAHKSTFEEFDKNEEIVPIRISRTASDGYPIRKFDEPFPAVDTATVWGWAQGNVKAMRVEKDRGSEIYIRNPNSDVKLWRISASRIRTFTAREFARLQTFPDSWEFVGQNKREIQLQIGNAVPVLFAKTIAQNVRETLEVMDGSRESITAKKKQLTLF